MTNNGPGYEGQQVCHLRTMAIMTKTLVVTKSDLNDIFPTKFLTLLSNSQGLMDMPVVTILIAQYLILHLTWQPSLRQHQLCWPKYYVQTYIQFPRDLTAMADVTVNTRIATLETHFWEFIFSFNLFGTVQSDDFNLAKSLDNFVSYSLIRTVLCSVSDFSPYSRRSQIVKLFI